MHFLMVSSSEVKNKYMNRSKIHFDFHNLINHTLGSEPLNQVIKVVNFLILTSLMLSLTSRHMPSLVPSDAQQLKNIHNQTCLTCLEVIFIPQ
jgi:hypothetical protein